jgi:hypothetical protein
MMMGKIDDIAAAGVTHVWLPPPSHSVSNEGPQSLPLSPNPFVSQHLAAKGKDKKREMDGIVVEGWSGEHAKFDCDVYSMICLVFS